MKASEVKEITELAKLKRVGEVYLKIKSAAQMGYDEIIIPNSLDEKHKKYFIDMGFGIQDLDAIGKVGTKISWK